MKSGVGGGAGSVHTVQGNSILEARCVSGGTVDRNEFPSSLRLTRRATRAFIDFFSFGAPRACSFLGMNSAVRDTYFHCSLKNPASTIFPGQRGLGGVRRSTIAQSGSFGVWRALLP